MNDRKQEAIEIIDKYLKNTHDVGRLKMQRSGLSAKNLYNRLLPLIRGEFPEEEVRKVVSKITAWFMSWDFLTRAKDMEDDTTDEIKRLWEGDIAESKKGSCQNCGGEGKYCYHALCKRPAQRQVGCRHCTMYGPCLACKGTGECQHKDVMEIEGVTDKFYCCDCQQDLKTRRSGEERRMKSRRDPIIERRHNPESGRNYAQRAPDRRTLKDRRNAETAAGSP